MLEISHPDSNDEKCRLPRRDARDLDVSSRRKKACVFKKSGGRDRCRQIGCEKKTRRAISINRLACEPAHDGNWRIVRITLGIGEGRVEKGNRALAPRCGLGEQKQRCNECL